MARLRDVPHAVRSAGLAGFVKRVSKRIADDDLTTQAAAVAYAWLFAVFPFLIFLITLAAYLPESQRLDAKQTITTAIRRIMVPAAAGEITSNLTQVLDVPRGGLLSVGLLITLWVASGGMRTTMSSLDTAYDAKRRRPFWVQWPLAVLLTVVVASMVAVVLVLLPIGSALEHWFADRYRIPAAVLTAINASRFLLAVVLVLMFLALLYQYGTVVKHPFAVVSPGAVFTLVIWFALGAGFRVYIDKLARYQNTYGTLGGVAILLFFFYLDALVLLVGAEINSQVDECCSTEDRQPPLFPPEVMGE